MEKLWEYRIKYNPGVGHSATDSYHYYNAESACIALKYHEYMMERHGFRAQILSVERKCPYANKWIDETDLLRENSE